MSKWPDGVLEQVLKMYLEEGKTQAQIARELQIDRATVLRNLKKYADPEKHAAIVHKNHKARSLQSNLTLYGDLRAKCVELFETTEIVLAPNKNGQVHTQEVGHV